MKLRRFSVLRFQSRRRAAIVIVVGLLGSVGAALGIVTVVEGVDRSPDRYAVHTAYHRLLVERLALPPGTQRPSIDHVAGRLIVSSSDGTLHVADLAASGASDALVWQPIGPPIATDLDVFRARSDWYWAMGVRDIVMDAPAGGVPVLYALHSRYVREGDCIVTQVSRLTDPFAEPDRPTWEIVYETAPCLPIEGSVDRIGGRIAMMGRQLVATFGSPSDDARRDEWTDPTLDFAQTMDSPYGKIIAIDLTSGEVRYLSVGHRNPQGLYVAPDGTIWSTDHGPRGGDELNLIEEGGNYGWPAATYGTAYSDFVWPPTGTAGRHGGYVPPVYAWVPSIGVSQLIGLHDGNFQRWQDSLLVTSLNGNTLFRLQMDEGRVVVAEPISFGERLRDIISVDDRIYIAGDGEALYRLTLDPRSSM